jgi:CubicO group peptidase (beta-lactamase class C family)
MPLPKIRKPLDWLCFVAIGVALPQPLWAAEIPVRTRSDTEVSELVRERLQLNGNHGGVIVGILQRQGESWARHFIRIGEGRRDGRAIDEHTLFEIGSITKTFSATLLAQAVERNVVLLQTPLQEVYPDLAFVPWVGAITLEELATHRSGLPRISAGMWWQVLMHSTDPYSEFSIADLLRDLGAVKAADRPKPVGEALDPAYSNFGVAALGQSLAHRQASTYESLLANQIFAPLGLRDTWAQAFPSLPIDVQERHAEGINAFGYAIPYWDFAGYAPAGSIRTSADELLTYAQAHLDSHPALPSSALEPRARWPSENPDEGQDPIPEQSIALGWMVRDIANERIFWHNGGTGGFRSYFGFAPATGTALVVLTNTAVDFTDFGTYLLSNHAKPPSPPTLVDRFVALWLGYCVMFAFFLACAWEYRRHRRKPPRFQDRVGLGAFVARRFAALGFVTQLAGGYFTGWPGQCASAALLALVLVPHVSAFSRLANWAPSRTWARGAWRVMTLFASVMLLLAFWF